MAESPVWAVVDLGAYLLSRAAHLARRALGDLVRRRRMVRLLGEVPELVGAVVVTRPIVAALSGRKVAACRVVIERARDDGTWESIFDETQLGELEIRHREGCSRIEGPLLLVCAEATRYAGWEVRTLLEVELHVDDDDSLRGTEYLLLPDERVHLFGISISPAEASGNPYRSAPLRAHRTAEVPVVVITHWSFAELRREFRRRPELLPRT